MNPPEWFIGDDSTNNRPSPRKEVQLQGQRPAALKVNKDSYKIKKPPIAPNPNNPAPPQEQVEQLQSQPSDDNNHRKPVIIYAVSPKVIHTSVTDFMNLVQRLTGNNPTTTSSAGDVSPAARLASIEKATSPSYNRGETTTTTTVTTTTVGNNNSNSNDVDEDIMGSLLQESDVELGRAAPGILSPAPACLPPISPGFFSPAAVDPFMMGYNFNNMFVPSPSTLFSSPMVSPSPSSFSVDLFNPFFDF